MKNLKTLMMKRAAGRLFLPFALMACVLTACNKFEYYPYDTRTNGTTHINQTNIALIEQRCAEQDTLRFAVISDTQRWYDETAAEVRSINADTSIQFVIHLGDLTDFGLTKEFEWMRRELAKLRVPYVSLIGNHDCLGTGSDVFRKIWGKEDFCFTAGDVRFVCLNTNAREYDHTTAVPDFGFIYNEIENFPEAARRTIVCMHARPFCEQFDNNVAQVFEYLVLRLPNLMFCINGHNHRFETDDLFDDGTLYYGCTSAGKRGYLVFTIYPDGYAHREVTF